MKCSVPLQTFLLSPETRGERTRHDQHLESWLSFPSFSQKCQLLFMWVYLLCLRNNCLLSLSKEVGDPEAELCFFWKPAYRAEPTPPIQLLRGDKEPATLVPPCDGEGAQGKNGLIVKAPHSSCFSHHKQLPVPITLGTGSDQQAGSWQVPSHWETFFRRPLPCSVSHRSRLHSDLLLS